MKNSAILTTNATAMMPMPTMWFEGMTKYSTTPTSARSMNMALSVLRSSEWLMLYKIFQ